MIAGAAGHGAEHVDPVFEREHLPVGMKLHRPPAADVERPGRYGVRAGGEGRRAGERGLAGRGFEVHHLQAADLKQIDPGDVRAGGAVVVGVLGLLQELDPQPRPSAVMRPPSEIDGVRGEDLLLAELDIAGDDSQVVFGPGELARPADRNLSPQFAANQPADVRPAEVERGVEIEHGPLRGFEHDRPASEVGRVVAVAVGSEHDHARLNLHLAAGERAVILEDQLDLIAFEDLGVVQESGPGGKERPERGDSLVDRLAQRPSAGLGSGGPLGGGGRVDQRHGQQEIRPIRRRHDREAAGDSQDPLHDR